MALQWLMISIISSEALEEKLTKIGAKIARVEDEKELQKFILKVS